MKPILFIDCGDTLCDESTEVRDEPGGVVKEAFLFPGAEEVLHEVHAAGIPIVLVADGLDASFAYILRNVRHLFSGWVASEAVGAEKPDARMFEAAMASLHLQAEDKPRIFMVGNNLRKDVLGANRFGLISVLADYSPRYDMTPHSDEEVPRYVIHDIRELPDLLERVLPDSAETYMTRDAEYCAKRNELDRQNPDRPAAEEFPQSRTRI